ncbi:hypothetical protein AMTRI_Chr05g57590 [Amborella trichopoda]
MIVILSICSLDNLIVFDSHSMSMNSSIAKSRDYLYGFHISMYYSFVYLQYYLHERLLYIHVLFDCTFTRVFT